MRPMIFSILILSFFFLFSGCARQQALTGRVPAGYRLVWSDEFDYKGVPDSAKWGYDAGDGCPNVCGWGNNELQWYTVAREKNARVEGGKLIIEAHKEVLGSKGYTSARMVSRGKGDWLYGRIEARAKLPTGRGTWPAIWMLPTDWAYGGWPASGEIDIMEHVGFERDSVWGSAHTQKYYHSIGTQKTKGVYLPDGETAFHVYAVEWTPERIDYFVDDNQYFTFRNEGTGPGVWPFDKRFHVILNLAVGGNWGGQKGMDDSIWPQRMEVDYVRVYQSKP